ncbi:MAG: NUDIX domain-containing protein [Chitinophagales bacterium]
MKKIFIGDQELIIGSRRELNSITGIPNSLGSLPEKPEKKDFQRICDFYQDHKSSNGIEILFCESEKNLDQGLFSFYKLMNAAGGVVKNSEEKLLMIFRRGKWDLPKGKVDKGETIRQAALREVMEETGIQNLNVVSEIRFLGGVQPCTYHTYEQNGKPVIKATYWYEMVSDNTSSPLTPQEEEDITEVGWYSENEIKERLKNSFPLVRWVLEAVGIK